jgi:uncharacterized repeat protein (TIGR02543 family)
MKTGLKVFVFVLVVVAAVGLFVSGMEFQKRNVPCQEATSCPDVKTLGDQVLAFVNGQLDQQATDQANKLSQAHLDAADARIAELTGQVVNLTAERDQANAETADLTTRVADLASQLESCQASLVACQATCQQAVPAVVVPVIPVVPPVNPPPVYYDLTVQIVGQGSVGLNPVGGHYLAGTVVTLTATPAEGWLFQGWSGDASGANVTVSITMNSDKDVTATFVAEPDGGKKCNNGVGNGPDCPPPGHDKDGDGISDDPKGDNDDDFGTRPCGDPGNPCNRGGGRENSTDQASGAAIIPAPVPAVPTNSHGNSANSPGHNK